METLFDLLFMLLVYCVDAGISILMFNSDGLDPYVFCRKMKKLRIMKEKNAQKGVYFPPYSAFFLCIYYY